MWIPVVLINAPYGGFATGNGSLPAGYLGPNTILPSASGTDALNGTVAGVLYQIWLNVTRDTNVIVWGPGTDSRCAQPYSIDPGGLGSKPPPSYSGVLFGPGYKSDAAEPHQYNFSSSQGDATVLFSNGYASANAASVSTCGKAAQSVTLPLRPVDLLVTLPFSTGDGNTTQGLVIPLTLSYHYMFPPNFGTWQVDNLSAPGGPGGGWAFSYSPCP
ncbi:MAG: hypothetical protein ACLPWO_04970 [Thermoplasmata archaeon]